MLDAADRIEARTRLALEWIRAEIKAAWKPLAAALAVMALGYAYAATQFQLAGDDWFAVVPAATLDETYTLNSGRWVQYLFNLDAYAPGFSIPLAGILFTAAGWLAARIWGWGRGAPLFVTAALFAVNPVLSEILVFKQAHLVQSLAAVAAVGAAGLIVARDRWWDPATLAPAVLLLTVVYATYQPLAAITVVVWAGAEVAHWVVRRDGEIGGTLRRAGRLALTGIISLALWAVSVRLLWAATSTGSLQGTRYDLTAGYVGPRTVVGHIVDVGRTTLDFWTRGSPFYAVVAKLAVPAAIVVVLIIVARRRDRWPALTITAAAALVTVLGPFLASIPRDEITVRYSALAAAAATTALWLSATTALAVRSRRPAVAATTAATAATAVALILAFGMTSAFTTLKLGYERDMAIAARMLDRLDDVVPPGLDPVPVHVGGTLGAPLREPFRDPPGTGIGDTIANCRLFHCQQFRLLNAFGFIDGAAREFVGGGALGEPAATVYDAMPSWPAAGSVTFTDGTVLIKLSG